MDPSPASDPEPEPEPASEAEEPQVQTFTIPFSMFMNLMMNPITTIPMNMPNGTLEERVTNQSFHEQTKYKKVASKDFINSLSVQKATPEMIEKKITCGICLEELQENEDIIELPCEDKHYFHIKKEECEGIYPWLKDNHTCPLCRHEFPSEEKEVQPDEVQEEIIQPTQMPTLSDIRDIVHQVIDDGEEHMLQEALYESLHK